MAVKIKVKKNGQVSVNIAVAIGIRFGVEGLDYGVSRIELKLRLYEDFISF